MNVIEKFYTKKPKIAWGGTAAVVIGISLALIFRTESSRASFGAWAKDESARVTCASGGTLIYDGFSTGKVTNETNSDGYSFVDSHTGRRRQVCGQCNIDYGAEKPKDFNPVLVLGR